MKLPAFFFDIDGTLLDYSHNLTKISPATMKALDALRKHHPTFIASGRTHCFIDSAILDYPFDGFVTCNGAYVEYQNQCIYQQVISLEAMQAALKVCDKYHAVVYLEDHDKIYTYTTNEDLHAWFAQKWSMDEKIVVRDFDVTQIKAHMAMIVLQDDTFCLEVQEALSPYFDVSRHVNQNSFDLTIQNENKAKGIAQVMAYFQADLQEAWAFGDAYNDLEMIASVGHGIAMGNAVEALKARAFDVTDEAWHDGIVSCLKKYQWID